MSTWSKLFTAIGVMLLIGLGLCGVDQFLPLGKGQQIGTASFFGFVLCVVAVLTLIIGPICIAVARFVDRPYNKP